MDRVAHHCAAEYGQHQEPGGNLLFCLPCAGIREVSNSSGYFDWPPTADELVIEFVQINTMDDFMKAFERTFSKTPLLDEHTPWPEEVRQAISERPVIGTRASIRASEENGIEVEIWSPRQGNGIRQVFKNASIRTGFPASLKFVDGKLAVIE